MIRLNNRELFYENPTCSHKIFSERAVFMHCSSVTVSKVLSRGTADSSKSTLLNKKLLIKTILRLVTVSFIISILFS